MADDAAAALGRDLIGAFDYVVGRFRDRLVGLDDEEFFWEPVAGCWTVREGPPGSWRADGEVTNERTGPVTTIAWRMAHLAGSVLGGSATWLTDGGPAFAKEPDVPHAADGAVARLERNWGRLRTGMVALDVEGWRRPIGEAFGPYAEDSTFALMVHLFDEFVHHAAEVSLLRDLYRDRPLLGAPHGGAD